MKNDLSKLLTVRIRLMANPCLWCWEILDTTDGGVMESSWGNHWTAYDSWTEAFRVGLTRLADFTPTGRGGRDLARMPVGAGGKPTRYHLLIMGGRDVELYKRFKRAFAHSNRIGVMLDRRFGERHQRNDPPAVERRRLERRSRPDVDTQIRSSGWSLVGLADLDAQSEAQDRAHIA